MILWLLEELGIDYELKLFARNKKTMRAGDELKETHPLGKSPQLVTAEGRVIAERTAIAKYLIDTFDTTEKFKPDPNDKVHDAIWEEELLSFGGNSLAVTLMIKMILKFLSAGVPFFIKPATWAVGTMVNKGFLDKELDTQLKYLDAQLVGKEYLMNTAGPTRADFCMLWYAELGLTAQVNYSAYPNIKAWQTRCKARDAWKRSLEKGNGYDIVDGFNTS